MNKNLSFVFSYYLHAFVVTKCVASHPCISFANAQVHQMLVLTIAVSLLSYSETSETESNKSHFAQPQIFIMACPISSSAAFANVQQS